MAFSSRFRLCYKSAELVDIYRLMLEKGIRLHKKLEAYVAGWKSEGSEDEDNEEIETEDVQYSQRTATEKMRLLPM